jgi:hypothetical protein
VATVRENILAFVTGAVAGITIANDYHIDVQAASRFEVEGNSLVDLPAAIVSGIDQQKLTETTRTMEWELTARVDLYLCHDKAKDSRSTDEVMTEAAGDLYKALMVDRACGGNAVILTVESINDFDLVSSDGRDTGVMAMLKIRFRHAPGDPEVQV